MGFDFPLRGIPRSAGECAIAFDKIDIGTFADGNTGRLFRANAGRLEAA